ncbi:pseudouridine synthase [Agarivorans litoreus]|uniref:pseudouridine synthase n=1 Tax=Agarivorans litoreus TaxID=1510455 RepID=UPI001C7D62CB|nr:16S rRNA pseudouridine(516) synthase [Agarivorans litoreus]
MRLDKFICKSTRLDLAQARLVISHQQVLVNQKTITDAAMQVHENNQIELLGERLFARPSQYFMIHKPAGCICSNKDEAYPSVFSAVGLNQNEQLHIAGRLDVNTTGLVLATDDGRWSFSITRPEQHCPKVYQVTLAKPITSKAIKQLEKGIVLQGEAKATLPAVVKALSSTKVELSICEGKFHQVKRMFAATGNRVKALHRQQIADIVLDIAPRQWRALNQQEIDYFS